MGNAFYYKRLFMFWIDLGLLDKKVPRFLFSLDHGGFVEHVSFSDIERGQLLGKGSFGTVFR